MTLARALVACWWPEQPDISAVTLSSSSKLTAAGYAHWLGGLNRQRRWIVQTMSSSAR
jgi:hypothetical protein